MTSEQFDFTSNIDDPTNGYLVVHLHNKGQKFHLTRQALLDTGLTHKFNFFYNILAKTCEEFNSMYGNFACLIERTQYEADVYMNVSLFALPFTIEYIQKDSIDFYSHHFYEQKSMPSKDGPNTFFSDILDLATMLGLPLLVEKINEFFPPNSDDVVETRSDQQYYCFADSNK